jgi:hypothetical protein
MSCHTMHCESDMRINAMANLADLPGRQFLVAPPCSLSEDLSSVGNSEEL